MSALYAPRIDMRSLTDGPAAGVRVPDLWLASNEGACPRDLSALLAGATGEEVTRYPRAEGLRADLAMHYRVGTERILPTAGGDDLLLRAALATLSGGREALATTPSFEMIPRHVALAGGSLREVPWLEGEFPIDAFLAAASPRTSLVFLVTPNNPTGAVARAEDLARVARALPGVLIVLDHAYVEYADEDLTAGALGFDDVVVLRTFSKAWGLAGLRVGYGIGSARWIARLEEAGNPYAVASLSLTAARTRLACARAEVDAHVARVRVERTELRACLERCGARALPSQANFVLARTPRAGFLCRGLASLGIAVRVFPGRDGLEDAVRITCPSEPTAFERLREALETVLAPRALLLDLDGVLADVSRSYRRAIIETARHFGVEIGADDIARAKLAGNANDDWALTQALITRAGVPSTLEDVRARFEDLYQDREGAPGLARCETLIPEPTLVARLAARMPLGIVTGRPRRDAESFLERSGLWPFVSALVTREDAPLKPSPEPVRLALQQLGERTAWMIGDTPDDLAAARGAAVLPLAVHAPGTESAAATEAFLHAGAALVLSSLAELEALLR